MIATVSGFWKVTADVPASLLREARPGSVTVPVWRRMAPVHHPGHRWTGSRPSNSYHPGKQVSSIKGMIATLYVDDEPGLLEVGKMFLERLGGFSVDTLPSAEEALECLASRSYDAIVSDYQMSGMDGIRFLREIRRTGSRVPFIIFTGRGREEVVIQALNDGADFYLQKGGDPESQFVELAHKIRLAVQQREAVSALRKSESRLRSLIESMNDLVFVLDRNLVFQDYFQPPGARLLFRPEFFVGKHFDAIGFPEPARGIIKDALLSTLQTGYPSIATYYLDLQDGRSWYEAHITSFPGGSGPQAGLTCVACDITRRRMAEAELGERQDKFSAAFTIDPDPIAITDAVSGTIVEANPAFSAWSGYAADELTGRSTRELNLWADPQERDAIVASVSARREITDREVRYCLRNGKEGICLFSARFISIGGKEYLFTRARDITEQKAAEKLLKDREAILTVLLNAPSDSIVRLDRHGTIASINEAGARRLGGTVGEVTGRCAWDLIPPEVARSRKEQIDSVFLTGRPARFDDERSGFAIHNEVFPIISPGSTTVEHVAIFARDITERKTIENALFESEEKYRTAVEKACEAVVIVQDGRFVFANESMGRLTGLPPAELIGKPFIDFIWPGDRALVLDRYQRRIAGEDVPDAYDFRVTGEEDRMRWVTISAARIHWEGKPATLNLLSDITGRKQAEEALRESEVKYRAIVENSFDGIVIHQDGVIVYANRAAERILAGGIPGSIVGDRVLPFVHPGFRDLAIGRIGAAADGFQPVIREKFLDRAGTVIDVDVAATPFSWQGRPAVHVVFREVSGEEGP